jgi:hypothetical protein
VLLSSPGTVHSVTIGSFTVSDADATGGTGCVGTTLTDNSASQGYDFSTNALNGSWTAETSSTVSPIGTVPGNNPDELFMANLNDGSSMITALVGDDNVTALVSGNIPCVLQGGVAGT